MMRNSFLLVRGAAWSGVVGMAIWQSANSQAVAQPFAPGVQAAAAQAKSEQPPTTPTPTIATPPNSSPTIATSKPAVASEPGYLGVIADDADTEGRGVRLMSVLAGGPAGTADLRVGDLVTSINGQAVTTTAQLAEIMQPFKENDEVTFVVRRGNEVQRLDIRLGRRPGPDQRALPTFGRQPPTGGVVAASPNSQPVEALPAPNSAPTLAPSPPRGGSLLGVRAVPLSREMQEALNLPEANGALIVEVRENSAAQRAGLPVEAVIVGIDGKTIYSPADLAEVLAARGPGAEVRLSYFRFGQLTEKRVRLGPPDVAKASGESPDSTLPEPVRPEPPKLPSTDDPAALRLRVRELESRILELESQLKSKRP